MLVREFKNANVEKEKFVVKIFGAFITLKVFDLYPKRFIWIHDLILKMSW